MATKKFDPEDFAAFLALLPKRVDGRDVRHAVEVRHASFAVPEFVALARAHGVAVIVAGDSDYPQIADVTAPFVYVRIMGTGEGRARGLSGRRARPLGRALPELGRGQGGRRMWRPQATLPRRRTATSTSTSSAARSS